MAQHLGALDPGAAAAAPLLLKLLERAGHGELQVLFGIFLALVVGAAGFEVVGLKPDLGALVIGMLIASHPASAGLAKSLFNLKICFSSASFSPSASTACRRHHRRWCWPTLPLKSALYYLVYSGAHLRVRTALLSTLALTNFSEFGLIVAAIAATSWISHEWLVALSLARPAS